jgi:hypothetical protein
VVTTAFYSAICFVDNILFPNSHTNPLNDKIQRFNNFDDYYKSCRFENEEKHTTRFKLVESELPNIKNDFQTLMENCRTARYIDYNLPPEFDT